MAITESAIKLFDETGAVVMSDVIRSLSGLPYLPADLIARWRGDQK